MNPIPVFYRPEQSSTQAASFSPSAGKPALVMADWLGNEHIAPRLDVRSFEPVSRDLLYQAHDKFYVEDVLNSECENGFGNHSPGIAASLPYTVGSIVAAARHVLECRPTSKQLNVAISPTSGFHHAGFDFGGGYCTFNGLMAAAIEVHRLGLAKRILILDFDAHYGNGTEDIIAHLGIKYVKNSTASKSYNNASQALMLANDALGRKPAGYYDLVLFQAGADIHVDDPLGGIMTTEEMKLRDQEVFIQCIMRNTPVVWNLAGGYQKDLAGTIEPVLALHRQTMLECIKWSQQ